MLQTRLQTVVCETLLPDVVVPERIKMITAMYVSSADLILVHYTRILHGGRLHGGPQKLSKLGVGACPGQYSMYVHLNRVARMYVET